MNAKKWGVFLTNMYVYLSGHKTMYTLSILPQPH